MNMQTGFGAGDGAMINRYISEMVDIMTPVMENSMILAAEYCKACGRDVILPEDMEYTTRYCAMYTVGQKIGSFFPDLYEEGDSEGEEEIEEVSVDDCPEFTRYSGDDDKMLQINDAYDHWDAWEPQSPIELMLKNAINSNEHMGT